MTEPDEVLRFWFDDVGPKGWYLATEALDARVRAGFGPDWERARAGGLLEWLATPEGALAYILLTDQFPRNMFRDDARAFATDAQASAAATFTLLRDWDMRIPGAARQFFYLPLMHAESLPQQSRCVRLFASRMPEAEDNLLHARAHREVIRRFGRFPHRNAALGRESTAAETAFLERGGYAGLVRQMREAATPGKAAGGKATNAAGGPAS